MGIEQESKLTKFQTSEALKAEGLQYLAEIAEYTEHIGKPIDTLVCLGSGIDLDEVENVVPKNITKMNVLASLALYYMGYAKKVVIAGGPTLNVGLTDDLDKRKVSEAESTADYLESIGVPVKTDPNIIEESVSRTTIQNAENSLEYINESDKTAIVASPYHLPRASSLFSEVFENSNKNVHLDESYASNKILKEFYFYIKRHAPELRGTGLGNIFDKLSLEIALILKNFEGLSPLGDGGIIGQTLARVAYKIPPVKNKLEAKGRMRGIDDQNNKQ